MKRRTPKRTLLMVLLLTGGAIINVGVAWGCVKWSDRETDMTVPSDADWRQWRDDPQLMRYVDSPLKRLEIMARVCRGTGVRQNVFLAQTIDLHCDDVRRLGVISSTDAGWPTLSFRGWVAYRPPLGMAVVTAGAIEQSRLLARTQDNWSAWRDLPLGVIWPGFAINTIFYAAILWLLFATPFALCRRIRARRGQCPACAYPVGASNVCTECGAALPSPSR